MHVWVSPRKTSKLSSWVPSDRFGFDVHTGSKWPNDLNSDINSLVSFVFQAGQEGVGDVLAVLAYQVAGFFPEVVIHADQVDRFRSHCCLLLEVMKM